MAITGPIYWNGTTFPSQSGDPVAITQTEFEDCCCGTPCTECTGTQTATVTDPNTCANIVSGVYTLATFDPQEGICFWTGSFGGNDMTLVYNEGAGLWGVEIIDSNNDTWFTTAGFSCVDGVVTGVATISKQGGGCDATVTLG